VRERDLACARTSECQGWCALRDLRARRRGGERRDGMACVRTLGVELIPLSLQASQVLDLRRHHNLIERHIGTAGARVVRAGEGDEGGGIS